MEEKSVSFGVRTFCSKEGRLTLNDRVIFLRSEANCCVFPETGHMPMKVEDWREILSVYRSYGINCMRFHSHCPPDAAFSAADELGILMQPELSHWNPRTAFEDEKSWAYYQLELRQILLSYGNHPSFVMLSFGTSFTLAHWDINGWIFFYKTRENWILPACMPMDPIPTMGR